MGRSGASHARTRARARISARLLARREEIEQAALARVWAIADPIEAADPEYAQGLKLAVSAALGYGYAALEYEEEHAPPVPTTLLAQARLAARSGVNLDVVLRRYFAGYALFGDFVVGEAEAEEHLEETELKRLLGAQTTLFDRLVVAVTEEYKRESENRGHSVRERKASRVRRLLAGEPVNTASLVYDFDGWHIGVVAIGGQAPEALRHLARCLDRALLLVQPEEETLWAWLGGGEEVSSQEILARAEGDLSEAILACGEPAEGITGWRETHRQALAALRVAHREERSVVRYGEVALLASILQDDVFATALRRLYLDPLAEGRGGEEAGLLEVARAYLAAGLNVSSAAAALGLERHTVRHRLRAIEERLGRPLAACATELDAALRLERLEQAPSHASAVGA